MLRQEAREAKCTTGAPSKISGGVTDIKAKCWVMCATSSRLTSASRGDAKASHRATSPAKKHIGRHAGRVRGASFEFRATHEGKGRQ